MEKLWGGRFAEKDIDPLVLKFTSSLNIDIVLAKYDCLSSMAHVEMLCKCGYISKAERKELIDVLSKLEEEIEEGTWKCGEHEDIHSAVQSYVTDKIPRTAKKLHTGRSRNEQVVNDVRLFCKDSICRIKSFVVELQKQLVALAERSQDIIIPGYTHMNRAQPILFAHLVMAYVEMLERDLSRLEDAYNRCDISVMGSGAIAGTALDFDRKFIAEEMGFNQLSANSIDAVSDRDFIIEVVGSLCFIAVHLSRICEDFILYSIPEFGFIKIGSAFCTGSSLMPQKKNPDVLELIRGRSAKVIGDLNSLFVLLKGLPHSYNRDLQEDKKPLFESVELVALELKIMAALVQTISLNKETARQILNEEFIYATDIAEYLVEKGTAFKEAHDIVGKIVKQCVDRSINISDLSISELKKISNKLDADIYELLNPETSVKNKKTFGSTNPVLVKKQITKWKRKLKG